MNRGRGGNRSAVSPHGTDRPPHGTDGRGPALPTGTWLFAGGDGLLTAYLPAPGALLRWTEDPTSPGRWSGPDTVEIPGGTGPVDMARSPEGYVHFIALRRSPEGAPEVAFATQFQSRRALTDWHPLGVPGVRGGPTGDSLTGPPRIVVNRRSGSVHVLVSLRLGGIVRRSRNPNGGWGGWKHISPEPVIGGITAAMPAGGALELLAEGGAGIERWAGAGQGRFALTERIGTPLVPGSATVCETGRGRATYFWRYPGDGSLVAWRAPHREVQGGLMGLGGAGGRGAPGAGRAMIGGYDCTVLAQSGAQGDIELTAYVTENEGYGAWWASLGGRDLRAPQVAVDGSGRIVVAALDARGVPSVARQDPGGDGLAFGGWQPIA
ncbi:hypothetical protein [Streptomyces sp. NPDC097619]|uniref:hypothetical protein n=1 Tax=Streptomyces sp. NPDC097619 TaxID=3157228 RepID=UPI00331E0867